MNIVAKYPLSQLLIINNLFANMMRTAMVALYDQTFKANLIFSNTVVTLIEQPPCRKNLSAEKVICMYT